MLRASSFILGMVLFVGAASADSTGQDPSSNATAGELVQTIEQSHKQAEADIAKGAAVSEAMGRVIGVGLSPIFGLAAYGLYDRMLNDVPARNWYNSWIFLIPILMVLSLILAKDVAGVPLGPIKQFADAGEVFVNKIGGSLGVIAMVFHCGETAGPSVGRIAALAVDGVIGTAYAQDGALAEPGIFDVLGAGIAGLVGGAASLVVWLTGQAFTIAIFLNPFSFLDPGLKALRTSVIGGVGYICSGSPTVGIILCVIYLIFSWYIAGFCIRFISWGTVLSLDTLFKRGKVKPVSTGIKVFAGKTENGPPTRSYGSLSVAESEATAVFRYRPWLIMKEKQTLHELADLTLQKGLIYSSLQQERAGVKETIFTLPPRYNNQEEALKALLPIKDVSEVKLNKSLQGYRNWMSNLFEPQ